MKDFLPKNIDTVIFDCDSTLSTIEGIDELARLKGKYSLVEQITSRAMNGKLDFFEALSERLEMIRPSQDDLLRIGELYKATITKDTEPVISALQDLGLKVYIVSGGFRESILPLADQLGVSHTNIFANEILFDGNGDYVDFNRTSDAATETAKHHIAERIPGTKAYVGDGASDLRAAEVVDLFIGYCGVARREMVVEKAAFVIETESMAPVLPLTIRSMQDQLGEQTKKLYEKGLAYWKERGMFLQSSNHSRKA